MLSDLFKRTFDVLAKTTGQNSFKNMMAITTQEGFLISAYEVITQGMTAANIDKYEKQSADYVEENKSNLE